MIFLFYFYPVYNLTYYILKINYLYRIHGFASIFLIARFELEFNIYGENITDEQKSMVLDRSLSDEYFNQAQVVGLINWLQWLRVFFVLRGSRVFGPMIETLSSMIRTLAKFTFLLLFVVLIYLFTGTILFSETDQFKDHDSGALFLFESMLGNFDFDFKNVSNLLVPKYFGDIYLGSFLAITMIVMLNFWIAILSDVYSDLKNKDKELYLSRILKID